MVRTSFLLPLLLTPSQVMAVSCVVFGLGSVAAARCLGDGRSWVGWEGVIAASYRVPPVVICVCFSC